MAKINLPGTFNSFPKGPKPPHYSPHAQRTVSAAASPVKTAQRAIENGFQRIVHATHALTPPGWSEARSPKPAAQEAKKHKPVRSKGGYTAPKDATDSDPYGNYYFALEIGGTEVAHFMECSGLKNASQVFEIQEGGYNGTVHKRPGQSKWENIVLKYATSTSTDLLAWRDSYLTDDFGQRASGKNSGSISIKSNDGKVLRRYHFQGAWPVSWEGPSLSAGSSDLAVETIEIAHDGLRVEEG
jgi:phage tail-like protein